MIKNLDFSFIGKSTTLKGDFIFSSDTEIAGNIIGNIIVQNNAKLILLHGASVIGKIRAHELLLYGHFNGELTCTGTLTVYPTGNLEGKIEVATFSVFPGAELNIEGSTTI